MQKNAARVVAVATVRLARIASNAKRRKTQNNKSIIPSISILSLICISSFANMYRGFLKDKISSRASLAQYDHIMIAANLNAVTSTAAERSQRVEK